MEITAAQIFTYPMPFLSPNQQSRITSGIGLRNYNTRFVIDENAVSHPVCLFVCFLETNILKTSHYSHETCV